MFILQYFYVLLDADKDLMLVDNSDGEVIYDGMMGAIPDEFDDCEVTDFGITGMGELFFELEVNEK